MKSKLLQLNALDEMRKKGRYSKTVFKQLMEDVGLTQSGLLKHIQKNPAYKEYPGSQLSNMIREKSNRKPTEDVSKFLEEFIGEKRLMEKCKLTEKGELMISAQIALECRKEILENNLKKIEAELGENEMSDQLAIEYQQEYENYYNWEDFEKEERDIIEIKNYIDGLLSDTMLSILYDNFYLFFQFNPILWDTIERLEQCTEEQRLRIQLKFKGKGSRTLKKKFREQNKVNGESKDIKDMLNFSWNCNMKDREQTLKKIVELWEQWNVPLWNSLEVFSKMNKEIWKITTMIILSDYYPEHEDFSPRIREKIDKIFGEKSNLKLI